MSAIDHYLQRIILRGAEEAQAEAGTVIEAQHLLLAIAAEPDPVLAAAGLDRAAIRAALDTEFAHSLAAAGVDRSAFDLRSTPSPKRPDKVGASAKLALERGFAQAKRKKDLRPAHITLGVLLAEVGTVPRALALAGIDRAGLAEQLSRQVA